MTVYLSQSEANLFNRLGAYVAGNRAKLVSRYLQGKLTIDSSEEISVTWIDEKTRKLDGIVFGRQRGIFTLIHEFGHAYHCYYFGDQSVAIGDPDDPLCVKPKGEAVAIMFELRLGGMANKFAVERGHPPVLKMLPNIWATREPQLNKWLDRNSDVLDILEKVLHDNPVACLHELVERVFEL